MAWRRAARRRGDRARRQGRNTHELVIVETRIGTKLLGKSDVKVVSNSTLILPYARTNPALYVTLAVTDAEAAGDAG